MTMLLIRILSKFYQSIISNISHIPDDQVLKTRIRNTCHKYNRINVPYRCRQIIRNLSNNEKIKVLRQDKGQWSCDDGLFPG